MKYFLLVSILLIAPLLSAQEDIDVTLESKDTFELNVIRAFPDKFPTLSLIFEAVSKEGKPIWNLGRDQVQVIEGEKSCPIYCLRRLSENKSINVGLVIDHSGSMTLGDLKYNKRKKCYNYAAVSGVNSPMNHAKKAVKKFISTLDTNKDSIQIIGFDEKIDPVLPYTNDINQIAKQVNKMQATTLTSLYDAIKVGLESTKTQEGIKIIIALSDGGDNSSTSTPTEIIALAKKLGITIYTIGFGGAEKKVLRQISKETGGAAYFSESSKSLSLIYQSISERILAIYELGYTSENLAADSSKNFKLVFDIDNAYVTNNDLSIKLPPKVVTLLKIKEKEARNRELYTYTGIGISLILLVGAISFTFIKRKDKESQNQSKVVRCYPNPVRNVLYVEYQAIGDNPQLVLKDMTGTTVYQKIVNSTNSKQQISLQDLPKGTYLILMQTNQGISNTKKIIKI